MMKKLFAEKVTEIISYNEELSACHQQFENSIKQLLELNEWSAGENWYKLTFDDFVKKALGQVTLTPQQKAAAERLFKAAAKEALELKALEEQTDKHINRMVHDMMEEEADDAADMRETFAKMHEHRAGVLKDSTVNEKKVKE